MALRQCRGDGDGVVFLNVLHFPIPHLIRRFKANVGFHLKVRVLGFPISVSLLFSLHLLLFSFSSCISFPILFRFSPVCSFVSPSLPLGLHFVASPFFFLSVARLLDFLPFRPILLSSSLSPPCRLPFPLPLLFLFCPFLLLALILDCPLPLLFQHCRQSYHVIFLTILFYLYSSRYLPLQPSAPFLVFFFLLVRPYPWCFS